MKIEGLQFDEKGRIWLTCSVEYPYAAPLDKPARDSIRVLEDTDGDGQTDKWEIYHQSVLTSVAFDTQHRGTPDRRLVYHADGSLDHIEIDTAGDGTFESVRSSRPEPSPTPDGVTARRQ